MNAPTAADFANDFALSKHDENQPRNRFVGDATFREDHVRMGSPAAAGDLALSAPAVPRPVAPSAAIPEALQESDDTRVMQETAGKSLEKVALNQFLEIWASTDAPDRYVANIDLQVLDVKQSADKFQVLLLKNGVATLENRELAEAKVAAGSPARGSPKSEPRENKGTNTNDDGSMIAVYVDTTADRVTKSLEELAKQHDVLGVRLQPPLALARLADDAIAPQAAVVSESLLRAELDDVTSAYANNQYFLAQDLLDEEGPVDALRVLPSAKAVPADNERLKQLVTERAAMRQQRARTWNTVEKEGVARSKDNNFGANSLSIGNTLNYSSVVKLPIANGFESAPAGAATSNTVLDAKPEPPLAVAQRRSTPALSELNANTAPAGRQRNAYNQAAANPVRLLVIFQDPMEDSQGKTPHP